MQEDAIVATKHGSTEFTACFTVTVLFEGDTCQSSISIFSYLCKYLNGCPFREEKTQPTRIFDAIMKLV
jgi:hypothetical protein